jgi:hypothetical protein
MSHFLKHIYVNKKESKNKIQSKIPFSMEFKEIKNVWLFLSRNQK